MKKHKISKLVVGENRQAGGTQHWEQSSGMTQNPDTKIFFSSQLHDENHKYANQDTDLYIFHVDPNDKSDSDL